MSDIVLISNNQAEAAEKIAQFVLEKVELLLKEKPFVTIGLSGNQVKKSNFNIFVSHFYSKKALQ